MALTEVYTLTFTYQGEVVTYTDYNYSALISLVTSLGITNYDLTSIIEDIIIEPATDTTDYTSGIENNPNTGDNTYLTKQDQYVTNN